MRLIENEDLKSEELDRHLINIEPESKFFGAVSKLKVGKTALTFSTGRDSEITFQKRTGPDCLKITTKWVEEKTARCSLGHNHIIETTKHDYDFFSIPWDQIDSFVEWLQSGTWNQVMHRESNESKALKETMALLRVIPMTDETKYLKPAIAKLKKRLEDCGVRGEK